MGVTNLNWNSRRNLPGADTCRSALRNAIDRIESEGFNKVLVLLLDDEGGGYKTGYSNAGMSLSQCVALMATVSHRMLNEMNGVTYEGPPDEPGS